MRLSLAIAAVVVAAIPFLILSNNSYSIYAQSSIVTRWGSFGTGDGQFSRPAGITEDLGSNTLYVVDRGNDRIQKFTTDGKFILKWGSSGTGDGQFHIPVGISVDLSGNVYVADQGNDRIEKFTGDGKFITKWTNLGLSGGGNILEAIYLDVGPLDKVYMTDRDNNRVQVLSAAGGTK
jgi:tripartite motif-containing protein 71